MSVALGSLQFSLLWGYLQTNSLEPPCGDETSRCHRNGYCLASREVLHDLLHDWTCFSPSCSALAYGLEVFKDTQMSSVYCLFSPGLVPHLMSPSSPDTNASKCWYRQSSSVEDPFPSLSVAKKCLGKAFQMLEAVSFSMRTLWNNLHKETHLSQVSTTVLLLLPIPAILGKGS